MMTWDCLSSVETANVGKKTLMAVSGDGLAALHVLGPDVEQIIRDRL